MRNLEEDIETIEDEEEKEGEVIDVERPEDDVSLEIGVFLSITDIYRASTGVALRSFYDSHGHMWVCTRWSNATAQ